jgi:hypothetical protein
MKKHKVIENSKKTIEQIESERREERDERFVQSYNETFKNKEVDKYEVRKRLPPEQKNTSQDINFEEVHRELHKRDEPSWLWPVVIIALVVGLLRTDLGDAMLLISLVFIVIWIFLKILGSLGNY